MAWDVGPTFMDTALTSASATQERRPTGASADRRTLFFFDEVAGHERAAWRTSAKADAFSFFADLPSDPEAAPTADCMTLYLHGMDSQGQGLFTGVQ